MDVPPAHDDRWFELLSAHADGELVADEAAVVDAHLASCRSCADLAARLGDERRRARMTAPAGHAELGASILAQARSLDLGPTPAPAGAVLGRRLAVAAVVVAAIGLGALVATDGPEPGAATQLGQRSILLDDDARSALVDADVTVPAGTTVRLRNAGDETHHLEVEVDGATTSADVVPGAADAVTYDEVGTYTYRCTIHPEVAGTVTVEEA